METYNKVEVVCVGGDKIYSTLEQSPVKWSTVLSCSDISAEETCKQKPLYLLFDLNYKKATRGSEGDLGESPLLASPAVFVWTSILFMWLTGVATGLIRLPLEGKSTP